ncbi:MAG TPA: hypothetical protein VND45_12370 [Thermoanaerobaculia bacterium]|jgi:hypothetical protein|nr:hypothetical protein [Thermoanaerobaculia bacterium]
MIRITCTSCQKLLSIDETRLPMQPVSVPCPVCKTKLTVDRRSLQTAEAPPPPPPHDDDHENELGAKAVIVGADDAALRNAARLVGFLPVYFAEAARAREFYLQEFPPLVLVHPPQMSAPPLEAMGAMLSVVPADRRKSFFVLVADGLRSTDGNAAFLYGVNLVVAKKDLAQFPDIYRDALAAHERMYASVNAVLRERLSLASP